nr:atrial natriuretic peptide receptor 3-like [Lytechinus pictus]
MARYWFLFVVLLASGLRSGTLANEIEDEDESSGPKFEVNVGVLLPMDNDFPYSLPRVVPGVRWAFKSDRIKALLPNVTANIKVMDSKCAASIGPLRAMENMVQTDKQRRLDLLLGPACDIVASPVARYNTQWKTCMMSAGCGANGFKDKKELCMEKWVISISLGSHRVKMTRVYSVWDKGVTTCEVIYQLFGDLP